MTVTLLTAMFGYEHSCRLWKVGVWGIRSVIIAAVIYFWMSYELLLNVLDLFLLDLTSADRALLDLGQTKLNRASVLIFLLASLHEPVAMDTNQVEPVETCIDSHQVHSIRKRPLSVLAELLQAHGAPSLHRVIVGRQDFPDLLV